MLTEKDYCDYDTCVALKELGYVGSRQECECFGAYFNFGKDIFTDSLDNTEVGTNEYLRVPLYQAQKWLREEKGIFVHISYPLRVENDVFWNYEVLDEAWDDGKQNPCICASGGLFDSYEEALLRGVRQAVNLLKEKK